MSPPGSAFLRQAGARPRAVLLAYFAGGASLTLAFAPFGLWPLAPIALVPLYLAALSLPPRRAAQVWSAFGAGLFLSGTYWVTISIHVFGEAPVVLAACLMLGLVAIMAAWIGACGYLLARLAAGRPSRLVLAGPAAWVAVEWLRGWVLSGFPWLSLGYSQLDSPLDGWLPVAGVYGASFAVAVSAAGLTLLLLRQRPLVAAAVAVLPFAAGAGLDGVAWTQEAGPAVRVTLVQGGVSQDRKWLPEQFRPTLSLYRNALLNARGSELVVWPEVAIPSLDVHVEPFLELLRADLARGQSLLLGILEQRGEDIFNSVLKIDAAERQIYRKRHLVPFGEFFPVPDFIRSWLRMLSLPHNDLAAGDAVQPLIETVGGERIAVAICYEDAYGSEQLYAFPDATLIVNVSNDAWFGDSIAPHQHLQIARVRAKEVGRYAVRATNNGISAFIGPDGALLARAPQFEFATLDQHVAPHAGATPYVTAGNWPVVSLVFGLLGVAAWRLRRDERTTDGGR